MVVETLEAEKKMRTLRIDSHTLIALNENATQIGIIRQMRWVSSRISFVWDTDQRQIVTDTLTQMMWELQGVYRCSVTLDHVPRSVFIALQIVARVLREANLKW